MLRPRQCIATAVFVAFFCAAFLPRLAQPAAAQSLMPGNYCVSCHTAADPRLAGNAAWQERSPADTACPAVAAYRQDLLYTEQLLVGSANAQSLSGWTAAPADATRLEKLVAELERLRSRPVTSLAAFHADALSVRYQGAKAYTAFNRAIASRQRTYVLIAALAVTFVVLGSLAWGLRNTLRMRPARSAREIWRPGWRTFVVAGLVLVIFALPIFRLPAAAVETPGVEEQEMQAALDDAGRTAAVADRSLARAWMLARVGAAWSPLDAARGEEALAAALAAEEEAQRYAGALWGAAQRAQEAAVGSPAAQEEAALRTRELDAVRSRAWALRLIAAEWAAVDKARAAEILVMARARAQAKPSPYAALDLAAIDAETLDSNQATYELHPTSALPPGSTLESARALLATLQTEAEKAEVLRFIAARTSDRGDFDRALAMAEAARVRGDALAPAEASLALARDMLPVDPALAQAAFAQAYDLALRIPVKYP